jgi:hypothetical protein
MFGDERRLKAGKDEADNREAEDLQIYPIRLTGAFRHVYAAAFAQERAPYACAARHDGAFRRAVAREPAPGNFIGDREGCKKQRIANGKGAPCAFLKVKRAIKNSAHEISACRQAEI